MAYVTTNPPAMISQRTGASAGAIWWYTSTDAKATVDGSGYISNADALGIKAGDLLIALDNDASPLELSLHIVSTVTAGGGADLSDGTAITATVGD